LNPIRKEWRAEKSGEWVNETDRQVRGLDLANRPVPAVLRL
jgi:hypothetical protein